jgi:drug/metabolite transporter (DMT)-like permease
MPGPTATDRPAWDGAWLGLLSAAMFGTSGPLAKSLLETGWTPGAAVTARIALAALALLGPAVLALRGRWSVLRRNLGLVATYGLLAMAGCQLFFFNSVQTLSVGVALLLEYLGLVLVVGWLWVRHGQRPRHWTLVGVALALAGLVLVLDVTGGMRIDLTGVLWGLGAAIGLAAYFVLSAHDETGLPPLVMAAGGMVVAAVTLLVAGLVGLMPMRWSTEDVHMAGTDLPWFIPILGLGVVAGALAYALGIASARRLGSKVAAFLGLTEVLFSILFAWMLLGELPLGIQLAGGALIIAGVAAVRYEATIGVEPVPELTATDPATPVPAD